MNEILKQDLVQIAEFINSRPEFVNKSIMITGTTGLIGSIFVKSFIMANELFDLNITIHAQFRNSNKFLTIYSQEELLLLTPHEIELRDLGNIESRIDYIIHTASPTSSLFFIQNPVETIDSSYIGSKACFDLALKNNSVVLYLSSMEYYGSVPQERLVTEDYLGDLDVKNPRNSYPYSKRMIEMLATSYVSQFGSQIKIARLAQIIGPGFLETETRVFTSFLKAIIKKTDIVLNTPGRSFGNYCDTVDAVIGMFTILLDGENNESYNVSNSNSTMSIESLAKLSLESFGSEEQSVKINIEDENRFPIESKMVLSSEKLESIGWKASKDIRNSMQRMLDYAKSENFYD